MGKKGSNQVEETSQQRALAEYARQQYADYKQRWLPVQKNLAAQIQEMGKDDGRVRVRAEVRASTDTAARFNQAEGVLEKSLANNANLGSSRSKLAITGMGEGQAKSTGLGITLADQQIDDAYTEGLGALAAIGRGERQAVGNSLARQADTSARQAEADAEMALQERAGNARTIGQFAGLGLQQGLGKLGAGGAPYNGTNDFSGVNGGNAMDRFLRAGSGGD